MKLATLALLCAALCGCARSYEWMPGPSAAITDKNIQDGRCSLLARQGRSPGAVAIQQTYNDCMLASGWVPQQ